MTNRPNLKVGAVFFGDRAIPGRANSQAPGSFPRVPAGVKMEKRGGGAVAVPLWTWPRRMTGFCAPKITGFCTPNDVVLRIDSRFFLQYANAQLSQADHHLSWQSRG